MTLNRPEEMEHTVGAQRYEVMFRDGTHVTLHPVFEAGAPVLFLRALRLPKNVTIVFDVRQLVRQLGEDLCMAAPRDVPGLVYYSLRHAFATAELMVRQVCEHGKPFVERTEAVAA